MKIFTLFCAVLLLIALAPLPIEYYIFLRIIVSSVSLFIVFNEYRLSKKINLWMIFFILLAIQFNPFFMIYLYHKSRWILIDIFGAVIFASYSLKLKKRFKEFTLVDFNRKSKNMINQNTQNTFFEENTPYYEEINYNQLGFRSAQKSQSKPEAIDGYLAIVYDKFLEEQKLDEQGIKERILKLNSDIQREKAKKQEFLSEINVVKQKKEDKSKEIEELEIEKIEIKEGNHDQTDIIPFVIGTFIVLLLTLYLFVFYSSSAYLAFYGVKPNASGVINPNVFSDAVNKGGGVIALIILFPVIFLGLGFLIHDNLEKNKRRIKEGSKSQFLTISLLLIITFLADAFIGYKISQGLHINEFNKGQTNELWNFQMVVSDMNFYFVLILGFIVYVIWGFLLNYVLSHPYLKSESEKVKLLTVIINEKITEKRKELSEIIAKIYKLESDVIVLNDSVENIIREMMSYEKGDIPINTSSLKKCIGEFMGGWQNYTYGNYMREKAVLLIDEAIKRQDVWLNNKIESKQV